MIADELLRIAAAEAEQLILDASGCPHVFSRSFERKMDRLVYRAAHPAVYKILKTAAILILVCTMLFAGLLAVSPQARATVAQWIKSVQTGVSRYFYTSEQITDMDKEYYLSYIPKGYTLYEESSTASSKSYIYINDAGQFLDFSYMYSKGSTALYTDNCDHSIILLNGIPADLYLSRNERYVGSAIAWVDPQSNILFIISAFTDQNNLIQLAESIKEK